MDRQILNGPKVTKCQWLSLIIWALLLIGVLALLIVGPGLHGAFSPLAILGVVVLVGLMLMGVICICCYLGYDTFNAFCFGPNMDKEEEKTIQQRKVQLKKPKFNPVKDMSTVLDIRNLHTPKPEPPFRMNNNTTAIQDLSLESNVYRKFPLSPEGGPFTVDTRKDGSNNVLLKKRPRVDSSPAPTHGITTVQPQQRLQHNHQQQKQDQEREHEQKLQQRHQQKKRHKQQQRKQPQKSPQQRQHRKGGQQQPEEEKNKANWFFSGDEDEDGDSFRCSSILSIESISEIENDLAARIRGSSTVVKKSASRASTAGMANAVESIKNFSDSFSDVPEPFTYETPVKHKKNVDDDLEIEIL